MTFPCAALSARWLTLRRVNHAVSPATNPRCCTPAVNTYGERHPELLEEVRSARADQSGE
ncbi:hypothetical protein [Streptomyces griseoviridis]|uniref:hypothetical protein n=1 Tax=Streptomyces griseoviridis TaxID=45398 RepID=UPI003452532D